MGGREKLGFVDGDQGINKEGIMLDLVQEIYATIPLNVLKSICREINISVSGKNKIDIARILVESLGSSKALRVLDEFRYAGRRAVSWFKVSSHHADNLFTVKTIREKLIASCGENPFSEMLKPKLSDEPKIVFAKVFSKEKVLCQFAHIEKRMLIIDYEFKEVDETVFISSCIRLSSLFFEFRISSERAKKIAPLLSKYLTLTMPTKIELTDTELNQLIDKLYGRLVIIKKKHLSGDFDTTEVVAAPRVRDLRNSNQFKQDGYSGLPTRKEVILFPFTFQGTTEDIKVQVNPVTGSFWFRSYVREQVIDYVFSKVKEVKGL